MLIGLVGPDFAGKEQVIEFLVKFHGFKTMSLGHGLKGKSREPGVEEGLKFGSATEALDFVMERWREHYVLTGIEKVSDWKVLKKRPFFLLVSVDAPVSERFLRYKASTGHEYPAMSLKEFVVMDDVKVYGRPYEYPESGDTHEERTRLGGALSLNETQESKNPSSLHSIQASAHVHLLNRSPSPEAFIQFLSTVDLVNHERLRPSWDMYFMKLCDLAASRSNCMKRRVGCIIVKGKRIIATGYNGTPRGITNCNEGGCHRCNSNSPCGSALETCLCLHAEENALLEAGRERIESGDATTLYCNTCPCLGCAKKIIQVGVKEVVYSRAYGMDLATERIFCEAGIKLRKFQLLSDYYSTDDGLVKE